MTTRTCTFLLLLAAQFASGGLDHGARGPADADQQVHAPGGGAAHARGLTHLAVTDHDRIDGALRARDAAPEDLTILIGEEVKTLDGDLVAVFLDRVVPEPGVRWYHDVFAHVFAEARGRRRLAAERPGSWGPDNSYLLIESACIRVSFHVQGFACRRQGCLRVNEPTPCGPC